MRVLERKGARIVLGNRVLEAGAAEQEEKRSKSEAAARAIAERDHA